MSAAMTWGSERRWSSKIRSDRASCRDSVAITYSCSGNPAAAGSSWALITRMTPDSLSQRTRCRAAAGDSPTSLASSKFVESASSCSAVSSLMSTSSSLTAIRLNLIRLTTLVSKLSRNSWHHEGMNTNRRLAIAALAVAGMLWGTTVPLSKLALAWLPAGWLTVARFGLAAVVLLVLMRRSARRAQTDPRPQRPRPVRPAATPLVLGSGAAGYGASVVLQNAGGALTSVTHAALLIGAAPVLVAVIAAVWHRAVAKPVAWLGFGVSLAGVGLVTGGHGGGGSAVGGCLVLLSGPVCGP